MDPQDPNTTTTTPIYQAPSVSAAEQPQTAVAYAAPEAVDQPYTTSVVVPQSDSDGGGVPRWFPIVFGTTLIVFFAITTLLVLSMLQKPTTKQPMATSQPTTAQVPTTVPRPTAEITASPSAALDEGADDVNTLDADAQKMNFSDVDETLIP